MRKVIYKPRTNACKQSHDLFFCLAHLKGASKSHISLSRVKMEVLVGNRGLVSVCRYLCGVYFK